MTTVVGIDPSLTAAGVSTIKHPRIAGNPNKPICATMGRQGSNADTITQTAIRIGDQTRRIWGSLPSSVQLVVIESPGRPNPNAPGRFAERATVYYRIVEQLALRRIPVVTVASKTVKKWATGSGDASKAEMVAAMRELWPAALIRNDNEADALALATMGAMQLGWLEPELPCHISPNVSWPKGVVRV
ncbi:hypothetical protein [Antrihabitans spumae]|uniref:Holliday junction nuclease RuvC n=1 Tax=Antrihabitans spumae TaxID=3373370 RepID=A0ABW7KMG1_9NOCA